MKLINQTLFKQTMFNQPLLNKFAVGVATIGLATTALAADPLANTTWQTYDDKTKKPAATVKITESNGVLFGKIISTNDADGKKYIGTTIIKNLKSEGSGKYSGGKILDPEEGKTYRLTATLKGKTLKIRGHLGPFYRTQVWKKK